MRGHFSIALIPVVLCLSPTVLLAGSRDFEQAVKSFQLHCRCKPTQVPLWGFVKPMFKMAPKAGTKALDVAIFEDQDFSSLNTAELADVVGKTLEPGWQPIICVQSRRDAEQTRIYAKAHGEDLRLMILTLERGEAVIMEARLSPGTLCKWLENPSAVGESMSVGKNDEDELEK
jgi:hypothetical protein